MTTGGGQSRFRGNSSLARRLMALGESGRCEFKSDVKSVDSKLLCTLANWVALDPEREVAYLLVGVAEVTDEETGLVRGEPYGLPRGLEKAVDRILGVARQTRPIPVDVFVVEEATASAKPFIRVEVRPTMPPHFDDEGRRQTRQGRSTRALTDEELLRVYLDREAGSFADRFRQTTRDLQSAVGAVSGQVDQIADAIEDSIARPLRDLSASADYAASAASSAESAANAAGDDVRQVEFLVDDLRGLVQELRAESPEAMVGRVIEHRRAVWWYFTIDTYERHSNRAERLARRLHNRLAGGVSISDVHNSWEVSTWVDLIAERKQLPRQRGTLKWWEETLAVVETYAEAPVYAGPELPDLRAEIRADIDKALDDPNSLTRQFERLVP